MNIVIAPDSFKECLSARAVADAIASGWRSVRPMDEIALVPIADGGEGTVEALVNAVGGAFRQTCVTGPMGGQTEASFGVLGDGTTAVIEMAAASGLALVPLARRDPGVATSRGTGELLLAAAGMAGVKRVVLGIGGSATNDGGAGFAQALGYCFRDAAGVELPAGGLALARLARIEAPASLPLLPEILVACDVVNPLCGAKGASYIYGPQKGATPEQVSALDAALGHYADVVEDFTGVRCREIPGSGAAGGIGFALLSFCGAQLRPGIEIVAEVTRLEDRIAACGLVITGEGRADAQSLMGKAVGGVLAIARRHGTPCAVLAGALGPGHEALFERGASHVEAIGATGVSLAESIRGASGNLHSAAARLAASL